MNEAKRIKQLKAWETWGKWAARLLVLAPWLVMLAMGVAWLVGSHTAVEGEAGTPIVCAIQNQADVGYQQLVVIRDIPPEQVLAVGYEFMGCGGVIVTAVACTTLMHNACQMPIPPVPVGSRLYVTVQTAEYAHKGLVGLAEPYWEIYLNQTVEEILPTEMWITNENLND